MKHFALFGVVLLLLAGCGTERTTQPLTPSSTSALTPASSPNGRAHPGRPGYEDAYYDGGVVTINAIEVPPKAPEQAQADFYEVVYPIGWESLGLAPPQCNPCDHQGNGIDFTDYHDHVLDSIPSSPGHGEYSALWHVYVIVPAYGADAGHNAVVSAAYAHYLPATSEEAVNDLLAVQLPDGSPVAVKIDAEFYFLCSVVSPNAAP
jgi:hypothetical protein